jgi:choline-sulfatase
MALWIVSTFFIYPPGVSMTIRIRSALFLLASAIALQMYSSVRGWIAASRVIFETRAAAGAEINEDIMRKIEKSLNHFTLCLLAINRLKERRGSVKHRAVAESLLKNYDIKQEDGHDNQKARPAEDRGSKNDRKTCPGAAGKIRPQQCLPLRKREKIQILLRTRTVIKRSVRKLTVAICCLLFFVAAFAQGPNILLITLDTTRADHLGCYGYKSAATPNIDALAAKGALFEEARTHCPLTLPSHATMLTGKLPSSLNLRVNGLVLNENIPMIQEAFKKRGYKTVAVVSSVILEKTRGLSRGFDIYDDKMTMVSEGGGAPLERRAEDVTSAALQEMGQVKGSYFLWVHYYDPHYEYIPPSPFAQRFPKVPYDGEISYMDAEIGKLLKGLGEKGLLANTLIILAGDHGEGLMEHNEKVHGIFLYEYALHVPLIMAFEGKIPPGKRVSGMCALSDIAPTVMDLLGLPESGFDGISLVPMIRGGEREEKPVYIESYEGYFNYGWAPLRGVMDREYKFIDAPKPELYRYRGSEFKNLYAEMPGVVSKMRAELKKYPRAEEGEKREMEDILKDPSNTETLRQLMSLGYLSGSGKRLDQPGLIDPKEGILIEGELEKAEKLRNSGNLKEAKELLAGILKKNSANFRALSILGTIYLSENKLEEAKVCYKEEVKLKPQEDGAHLNLGTVHKRQGNMAAAEKEYRAALAVNPRMTEAVASLARMLLDQKRSKEAKQLLESAIADHAESADVYFVAGTMYGEESDLAKAKSCFVKAVSLNPLDDVALANAGQIAFITGKMDEALSFYERAAGISPDRFEYNAVLGSLSMDEKHDPDKALFYFRKALASAPEGKDKNDLRELVSRLEKEKTKVGK